MAGTFSNASGQQFMLGGGMLPASWSAPATGAMPIPRAGGPPPPAGMPPMPMAPAGPGVQSYHTGGPVGMPPPSPMHPAAPHPPMVGMPPILGPMGKPFSVGPSPLADGKMTNMAAPMATTAMAPQSPVASAAMGGLRKNLALGGRQRQRY